MALQFPGVDWVEVHERLTLAAYRLFGAAHLAGAERLLESYGVGPEDLANEVLCALLDPENMSVTWNTGTRGAPTTKGIVALLVTTMKHDYLEKVRAKRRKAQHSLYVPGGADDEVRLLVDPVEPAEDIRTRLVTRAHREPLRKRLDEDFAARPDDELQLYIMLQFDGDRYVPYKPREAAQELGVPVERIYLLKEKFERRLLRLFRSELEAAQAARKRDKAYEQEKR